VKIHDQQSTMASSTSSSSQHVSYETFAPRSTAQTSADKDDKEAPLLRDGTVPGRHFTPWVQFAGVASYFGCDLFLRFLYQAVLSGRANANAENEHMGGYDKPALLTLSGYICFSLWGPILVFPYILFVRNMSLKDYYTGEWCGALGFWPTVKYTGCMAAVLFFGNLFYVNGLRFINVALATSISQGEAPTTVLLSVLFLGRIFGPLEKRGVVLCLTGMAFIAVPPVLRANNLTADAASGLNYEAEAILRGVFSTLCGALGFGTYQVFWPFFDSHRYPQDVGRPTKPQDAVIDTFATLTVVGLYCILFGWIFILFMHLSGLEPFEAPPEDVWGTLAAASLMSALDDALNGVACVLATAVVVALAYPLIIPMSVVMDYFINGISISSWGAWGWIGTIVVVAGVFCLEADGKHEDDSKEEFDPDDDEYIRVELRATNENK
jgi:drug/metabolite transporter (DMT)-like permease